VRRQDEQFTGTAQALSAVLSGLSFLAAADAGGLPVAEVAACLRGLEQAESIRTAARAALMSVFTAQAGCETDGQGTTRTWLAWQARMTGAAASTAVGWMRRLSAHPRVGQALAAGEISPSWARQLCTWTDMLPADCRDDGDQILLAAAEGGADLAGLSGLAEEMYNRCAGPDRERDRAERDFQDRNVRLDLHFRGAGKLAGDLTPECAAALSAVLDSLAKKAGPEDDRTRPQRAHDALEEACRRLVATGMLPDVAGQPTQIQLHLNLDQLRGLPGAAEAEREWLMSLAGRGVPTEQPAGPDSTADQRPGQAGPEGAPGCWTDRPAADSTAGDSTAGGGPVGGGPVGDSMADNGTAAWWTAGPPGSSAPGWLAGRADGDGEPGWIRDRAAAEAYACDAQLVPIVTGHLDLAVLAAMAGDYLEPGHYEAMLGRARRDKNGWRRDAPPSPRTARRVQDTLLRYAADVLSGPAGLAAFLRTGVLAAGLPAARWPGDGASPDGKTPDGKTQVGKTQADAALPVFPASVSLPLDTGAPTPTVPPHLRRAVARRDRRCAFPGCRQRPRACQVHHLIPRSRGGPTALWNLALLCSFHHLIAIHRWGWSLTLHADGTTTAISPDGIRTLHSHGPPSHGPPSTAAA
jgi:hypothetical protein